MGLRILYQCNAPWAATGYGVQGKHLVPRLRALGHELAYFAFYGLQGGVLNFDGTPILPMGHTAWGEDILPAHMRAFRGQVHISLMDVWVTEWYGRFAQQNGWVWCPWTPIDQNPVPKLVLERLEGAHTVLPYAAYGERELRRAGMTNVRYIPHGVDSTVFMPRDRVEARRQMGIPESAFVVGMVAANKGTPSRKCFPEQLLAFAQFKRQHPDALLYIHSLRSAGHGGVDFNELIPSCGLKFEDVLFSDQYRYTLGYPETGMATLYNAFDVLSMTSMGEGFGIPLIEAQACGVPVVTAANTAMPELTFAGVCVREAQAFWTPLNSWAQIPNINAIAAAYEQMYDALHNPEQAHDLAAAARAGALAFDWDRVVADFWAPFLAQLETEIGPS